MNGSSKPALARTHFTHDRRLQARQAGRRAKQYALAEMRPALKLSAAALMAVCVVRSVVAARRQATPVDPEVPDDFAVASRPEAAVIESTLKVETEPGQATLGRRSRPLRQSPNSAAVPSRSFMYSFQTSPVAAAQNAIYPLPEGSLPGAGGISHGGALRWSASART